MTIVLNVVAVAGIVMKTFAVAVVETDDVDGVFGAVAVVVVVVVGRGKGETGFTRGHC